MSERNVELHRRVVAAYHLRDAEAFIACFDPQIEFHSRFATVGEVTVYRGHAGLRSWKHDLEEALGDEIRVEVEAYFDLGEQTLAFVVLHGRGRQSGLETTMPLTQVMRWRDGVCVYWKYYVDREEALGELGVTEDEMEPIAP